VIPHPHGGRAIPISERQILSLREKSRRLESKLSELIRFGEQNDAITEKLHRLTLTLIAARDLDDVLSTLARSLREDFAVPHVAVRLAGSGAETPMSEEARSFAAGLNGPYCSVQPMADTAHWFGADASELRSFAYVPLRGQQALGLLALAAEDAQRFYPEMGTLYLRRLGDIAAAAIQRNDCEVAEAGAH
jgi:uncharacterized protein YigA (DUF484 family)